MLIVASASCRTAKAQKLSMGVHAGLTVGIESRICRHYALSLNCRRGLTDQSSQYVMKGQSITLALGYVW